MSYSIFVRVTYTQKQKNPLPIAARSTVPSPIAILVSSLFKSKQLTAVSFAISKGRYRSKGFGQCQILFRNIWANFVVRSSNMKRLYDGYLEILKIQKFRRMVSYAGFYCFTVVITYAYTNNTTRAGYSRGDQFYASYPAGTELLTDTAKLYKAALGNCFEEEEWGPIEWSILAKHFERQGKSPYAYHAQYMAHLASHGQLDGSG